MTKEIEWLSLPIVLAIHDEQLVEHGGAGGVRDIALLESALNRLWVSTVSTWSLPKPTLPR